MALLASRASFKASPKRKGGMGFDLALSPPHGLFDIVRATNGVAMRARMAAPRILVERSRVAKAPAYGCGKQSPAPIVFGLLLTMNAATLTCRATRGPPTSSISGGVGRGGALFSFL